MAPYTEPASNSVETTAPGSVLGADTGRWVPPHAATPPARNAIAAARLTCSTSNPGVSFARSHAQREPRRSDHRRLPPPRARRRGRHGRSVPSPTCGARDLCVQGIAVAARERPHGREALPAGGRVRLAGRAPGRRPHVRLRRSGRPLLPRSGVGRRQIPRRIRTPRRPPRSHTGREHRTAARRCPGRRPSGGQHPHGGRTPRELFQQLLTKDPTPLNEAVPGLRFPPGLEAAVMQGLERDPGRRPPTVTAFAANVTAALAAAPSPRPGLFEALKRAVRRKGSQ